MRYSLIIALIIFPSITLAKNKNCKQQIENKLVEMDKVREINEWKQYGVNHDGVRYTPPTKCTPQMERLEFVPLSKRKSGGSNRDRYMDKNCHIYEWDSQHARFEVYRPSGNDYYHMGEMSALTGERFNKADAKRNYTPGGDIGYSGYTAKTFCKELTAGKIRDNRLLPSSLKCRK